MAPGRGRDGRTPAWSRRRLLTVMVLTAPAAAGCGVVEPIVDTVLGRDRVPDPLLSLAAAASADAALVTAAIVANPELGDRLRPLADARREHAASLDAEVTRLDPDRTPSPVPPASNADADLDAVRAAVRASGEAASAVALGLPPERVGLVGSVAACCGAYAEVLAR